MDFINNLSIRTKIFTGIIFLALVFLILLVTQFKSVSKINRELASLQYVDKASNLIHRLALINKTQELLLLEIVNEDSPNQVKKIYENHSLAMNEIKSLYDSVFDCVKKIYLNDKSPNRINVLNTVNGNYAKIIDILQPYFVNVHTIKTQQFEHGDKLIDVDSTLFVDSIGITQAIRKIKEELMKEDTRSVQLLKLYDYYSKSAASVNNQYNIILGDMSKEFEKGFSSTFLSNQNNKNIFVIFMLIIFILAIIILLLIGTTVSKPLKKLENFVLRLSEGDLPKDIEQTEKADEIGRMERALNTLTVGLKSTSEFALEMGRNNFTSKFEPLSNKDVLGNALLNMRTSLQAAKVEEDKRKIEDRERSWTTEGLALFGDILRKNTENISLLSRDIIQNLVKYLKINQGGIFILNDLDKNDIYLELMSAYAYNREKFTHKRIKLGEGLVGGVGLEKYTVYMTDLPEDYIDIESGLGSANPRSLLIVPVKLEDNLLGVIELASFEKFKKHEIALVEKISESIASTLSTTKINTTTAELLEKSRIRAQEMKKREQELRDDLTKIRTAQRESVKLEKELKKEVEELQLVKSTSAENLSVQAKRLNQLKLENDKIKRDLEYSYTQTSKALEIDMFPFVLINKYIKIRLFNKAAERISGYSQTELIGRGLDTIFDKEVAEEIGSQVSLFYETKRKGLIDKEYSVDMIGKLDEKIPIAFRMKDIYINGEDNILLFVKNYDVIRNLEKEREDVKELLLSKEFDYSVRVNNLEYFIRENNLRIPDDIEARTDLIVWQESYSIGLNVIDDQHKRWIEFINIIYRAYKLESNKENVLENIDKLLDYADYHFGFEEKYIEYFQCSSVENVLIANSKFVENIRKLRKSYKNGDEKSVYKLIIMLKNETFVHIEENREYVPCFKKNGLR